MQLINKLMGVKEVQSRYLDSNDELVYDYLDVMYHPPYSHDRDSFPEHFTFGCISDPAILFVEDIEKVVHLDSGWMSFDDPNHGTVEFMFID